MVPMSQALHGLSILVVDDHHDAASREYGCKYGRPNHGNFEARI
jgi:hypothetical protein